MFYPAHEDCLLLAPSGLFEQCGPACVPRRSCPPVGCEFLGAPDGWQLCNGHCVHRGECLETACRRLSTAINHSFSACNGSCVPTQCEPIFVNASGSDWIRIQISAFTQLSTPAVINEGVLIQLIADTVGQSLGVRSEAIAVNVTSVAVEIRSRMVLRVNGELEKALLQEALANTFGVQVDAVSLDDALARRSLQTTRSDVPFTVRIAGTDAVVEAETVVTLIRSAAFLAALVPALLAVGHPTLESMTVTSMPEVRTSIEYTVIADGIPNAPGAADMASDALGPARENVAGLAANIIASGMIAGATILSSGVVSVSTDIAAAGNVQLEPPTIVSTEENSSAASACSSSSGDADEGVAIGWRRAL